MVSNLKDRLKSLEPHSPLLFYIAGGLTLVFTYMIAAVIFQLPKIELRGGTSVLFNAADILVILAIFGLYRVLSEEAPRLTRYGLISLAIAGVLYIYYLISNSLWLISKLTNTRLAPSFLHSNIGNYALVLIVLVGFALFSLALIQSDHYPKILGILLIIPAFTTLTSGFQAYLIPEVITMDASNWISLITSGLEGLALIGMGFVVANREKVKNYTFEDPLADIPRHT